MQQKPCLHRDASFGDVGLSSPAWYGCLTLASCLSPPLFRNKSLHVLWLSNLDIGNDGCRTEVTHIQSQRVRLRITLERVIKNSPAPLETIRGLPSPWPLYLGTVSVLAALSASSLWLALAHHASGSLSPLQSSSSELPGFRQMLQGALWSLSRHLGFQLGSWVVIIYT